jgi:DNA-binding NtrC family response regulator
MTPPARLLLADDEDTFRTSVALLLRREGYLCDIAATADEAIERLSDTPYDLLITDLRMPGNDDQELFRAAAAGGGTLPVIVVTASPSLATAIEAVRCAVVDYLVKPFAFEELLRSVRRALETRKAARMLDSLRNVLGDGGTIAQIARRGGQPHQRPRSRFADAARARDRSAPCRRASASGRSPDAWACRSTRSGII